MNIKDIFLSLILFPLPAFVYAKENVFEDLVNSYAEAVVNNNPKTIARTWMDINKTPYAGDYL